MEETLNIISTKCTSKLIATQLETNTLKPNNIIRLEYENNQILERTSQPL